MELFVKLLVAGGVMGLLDFIWLGTIAKKFYRTEIGQLLLDKPNMPAALLFYGIYVVGVVLIAVNPAQSVLEAALKGALLGFVAFATYDLTNLATMKGFSAKVVAVDMLWGTLLTAAVAAAAYAVAQRWFA